MDVIPWPHSGSDPTKAADMGVFSDVEEWKSIRQADLCHPTREPHLGSAGWPDRLQHTRCTAVQITLLCSNGNGSRVLLNSVAANTGDLHGIGCR